VIVALVPVLIVAILAITFLIVDKRQSRIGHLHSLEKQSTKMKSTLAALDSAAEAEYLVTNNGFAGYVRTKIKEMNNEV